MKHLTAAVRDAVLATNTPAWDPRHNAQVFNATYALKMLAVQAALRGPAVEERLWNGYFKLAAHESHRLPALVSSITLGRLDDVARSLLAYNDDNH